MRWRSQEQAQTSIDKLLENEALEHDREYQETYAFGSEEPEFTINYAWKINEHVYKKGTYKRGFIKRRMFQSLDLDTIGNKKVLDVGCGNGQHSVFMAMHGAVNVTGFDLSPVGIEVAKLMAEKNGVANRCRFELANASNLPYEDEEFDIILLNAVLHHLVKYPNIREETWRVLKKGGRVIIVDGLRDSPIYRWARDAYKRVRGQQVHLGDVDLEEYDIFKFIEGFTNVKTERRCLFEGVKEGIARSYNNTLFVRAILFLAKLTDDIVLGVFPGLRSNCTEILISAEKPA